MNGNAPLDERPNIEPDWLMPLADAVLVFLAFALAYLLRYEFALFRPVLDPGSRDFFAYMPYAAFYAFMLFLSFQANGLYKNIRGRSFMEELMTIIGSVGNAAVILLAIYFALQPLVTSRLMLAYVAGFSIILLALARIIRHAVLAYYRTKGIGVQRVLIIGMGDVGKAVLRTLLSRRELGYKVVGYLDDDPERGEVDLGRVVGLGKLENLENVLKAHGIDLLIITLPWRYYDQIAQLTTLAQKHEIDVRLVPDIFQLNLRQVQFENLDGIPLLGIQRYQQLHGASRLLKRALDVGLVLLSAPVWGLLFFLVGIAIKLEDGGSVFYKTTRVGENGREFQMWKFRSMIPDADKIRTQVMAAANQDLRRPKIVDDPRITKVGRFIRRTSIDELPNLINILRGEMSLVGPRPPIPEELTLYEPWHLRRLQTIPGLTGLWQVSGRSEIPFDEMVLMDIYYIENWSLRFDLQILLMTIPKVLMRSGAY
jgi:exopolysaccharide biosynthesis polyprenyl glycosylphosphotransferase